MRNIYTSIALFFFVVGSSTIVYGQKVKDLLSKGDHAFSDQKYYSAKGYYAKALSIDTVDLSIQYRLAEASRLNYDFDNAEHWYTNVHENAKELEFPLCDFWLAKVKKTKGDYDGAVHLYAMYARRNKTKATDYYTLKALKEVESCYFAKELIEYPDTSINIIHLDSSVNSTASEYAPFQIDSLLYFSSVEKLFEADTQNLSVFNKIYIANEDSLVFWNFPVEGGELLNTQEIHNANVVFNSDNTKMFLTRCYQEKVGDFICDIYQSEKKEGKWEIPIQLPKTINKSGFTNTQPAIGSLEGKDVLFFASNRPGGVGGMDIWYSEIDSSGNYSNPINAGEEVNSIEDEITPYYCDPCQELFFSSTWYNGFGGFDIFQSEFLDGRFSEPINLESPINTSYDDIYFSFSNDKTQAYFSSNREGSFFEEQETCCNDIYLFEIPKLSGDTIEEVAATEDTLSVSEEIKQLKYLTVYFHNDTPGRNSMAVTCKENYRNLYYSYMNMQSKYKNGYSRGLSGEDAELAKNVVDGFFLDSIDGGMNDLRYYAGLIYKALQEGKSMTITMQAYSSPLGNAKYNLNLSKRRMASLDNYFKNYNNGVLIPYFEGSVGALTVTIIQEFYGETKSKANVNNDLKDLRNSVYSPAAAAERKIQILLSIDP